MIVYTPTVKSALAEWVQREEIKWVVLNSLSKLRSWAHNISKKRDKINLICQITPYLSFPWVFFSPDPFLSMCIHLVCQPAPELGSLYLQDTRASLPRPSPAINQQQGWRGQTEEPTQPAQWLPQSIISQKISIIADGWLVWLAAGLAKQAHFRAVWSASPTVLRQKEGVERIEKGGGFGDLVLK